MFRSAAFLIAWLLAVPAFAGMPPGMRNPQVRPANASAGLPAVDDNLGAGGYPIAGGICAEWGHQVPCNDHYSTTRASTKYVMASDGLFTSVPSNVLALGNNTGGLIEEARTNLALWSRDLTQSGTWIAVTMTANKNAVGIDGAANSATTLTSSSAAGTILQSLTQSSAAYTYTVYVKGVTVTGAIQVADYPVLTPAFTTLSSSNCFNPAGVGVAPASGQTGFLRCTVTATSLNPVIGFKFANSGDSIVVDFNQLEAGSFGTSPIATTSATATRAADLITIAGSFLNLLQAGTGSVAALTNLVTQPIAGGPRIVGGTSGTFLDWIDFRPTGKIGTRNSSTALSTTNSVTPSGAVKSAFSWGVSQRNIAASTIAAASDTNAFSQSSVTPQLGGGDSASTEYLDGYLQRVTGFSFTISAANLPGYTQ